ncbi:hypothetical protein [Umezawaea beigongshangensis]|uniref:hypothetical protein n=1 Tax=Umezawaea beigongshangensis TaxID=2780383 RepID=UPI0018F22906|nr:hypothetical protein [Umezawaea beigongshangensis]
MSLQPAFADFSATPPRTANASVHASRAHAAGDHWTVGAGGSVRLVFDAGAPSDELTLKIRALVSKSGPSVGRAPLDVLVNDEHVIAGFRIPGGGDLPQTMAFVVPADLLRTGQNVLELRSSPDSSTTLRLYQVLLESVWDRDAAERALRAEVAAEAALTYTTRSSDGDWRIWRPEPRLRLWLHDGRASLPAELSWRGRDGGEASVVFTAELNAFLGHLRTAEGEWRQFEGHLVERAPRPPRPAARFRTDVNWGRTWHRAGLLGVHLDAGIGRLDRMSWRDQRGVTAWLGLSRDGTSFTGHRQNVGEGPVGYRGTAAHPFTPPGLSGRDEHPGEG